MASGMGLLLIFVMRKVAECQRLTAICVKPHCVRISAHTPAVWSLWYPTKTCLLHGAQVGLPADSIPLLAILAGCVVVHPC